MRLPLFSPSPLDARNVTRYSIYVVIKSFQHKGLKTLFETGSRAGIEPHHASRLRRQLAQLDVAKDATYVNIPGWRMHALTGPMAGQYAVTVNGNWRLTFAFDGGDAVLVDYQDYH